MQIIIPDYYREFRCTADSCEDTCCAGWQIMIDKSSMKRYNSYRGSFQKKLRQGIDLRRSMFRQDSEKRCAFLTEDNLCEMYRKLGRKSLCRTCKRYPRHIEEFEGVREITLSLSCPEAARLLLYKKEPVSFLSFDREGEEEYDNFDPFLYSALADGRDIILKMLRSRKLPVLNRIFMSLGLAWDMQIRVDNGKLFSCGEMFSLYERQAYFAAAGNKADRWLESSAWRYAFSRQMFENLFRLELLREDWNQMLEESAVCLLAQGKKKYQEIQEKFTEWMYGENGREQELDWEILCEQLMVYFVFTYFCGAVYDGRVFVNVQMAAASVSVIWDLLAARWIKNKKELNMEDVVDITYRFSRELEHSDNNLKKMWKMLGTQEEMFR